MVKRHNFVADSFFLFAGLHLLRCHHYPPLEYLCKNILVRVLLAMILTATRMVGCHVGEGKREFKLFFDSLISLEFFNFKVDSEEEKC